MGFLNPFHTNNTLKKTHTQNILILQYSTLKCRIVESTTAGIQRLASEVNRQEEVLTGRGRKKKREVAALKDHQQWRPKASRNFTHA